MTEEERMDLYHRYIEVCKFAFGTRTELGDASTPDVEQVRKTCLIKTWVFLHWRTGGGWGGGGGGREFKRGVIKINININIFMKLGPGSLLAGIEWSIVRRDAWHHDFMHRYSTTPPLK